MGGASVLFVASAGTTPDSVKSDPEGYVRAAWKGDPNTGFVRITAQAIVGGKPVSQVIEIGRVFRLVSAKRKKDWLAWRGFWSGEEHWYQEKQLPHAVPFAIEGVTDPEVCAKAGVLYKAFGEKSVVSPDTAWGRIYEQDKGTVCEVRAQWKLGTGVGLQTVRGTLVSDKTQHVDFRAKSRALPWIGFGVATTRLQGFQTVSVSTTTSTVTRTITSGIAGDTTEITTEVEAKSSAPSTVKNHWRVTPIAAASFPLVLKLQWLRATAGIDLADPTRNWYFGLSIPQVTSGYTHEDVNYDVQLVWQLSRRSVLRDPSTCVAPSTCKTDETTTIVGYGVIVVVNTSSVLDKILAAFIPK